MILSVMSEAKSPAKEGSVGAMTTEPIVVPITHPKNKALMASLKGKVSVGSTEVATESEEGETSAIAAAPPKTAPTLDTVKEDEPIQDELPRKPSLKTRLIKVSDKASKDEKRAAKAAKAINEAKAAKKLATDQVTACLETITIAGDDEEKKE